MKFKNSILSVIILITMLLSVFHTTLTANAFQQPQVSVKVNGEYVDFDRAPVIQNDRTLVPFRAIAEAMGATVNWNDEYKRIYVEYGSYNAVFYVGENYYATNGYKSYIDQPPLIINGRTMVPARIFADALGAEVFWDNDTKTVSIETIDTSRPDEIDYLTIHNSEESKAVSTIAEYDKIGYLSLVGIDFNDVPSLKNIKVFGLYVSECSNFSLSMLNSEYITSLSIYDTAINNSELISSFNNIERLAFEKVELDKAELQIGESIKDLIIRNNDITGNIDLSAAPSIESVAIYDDSIRNILLPDNVSKLNYFTIHSDYNLNTDNLYNSRDIIKINGLSIEEYNTYKSKLHEIADLVNSKCTTDLEKAIYAFWYISRNTSYDYDGYKSDKLDPIKHTGYAAIIDKSAVCDGFANTYTDVLDILGIESIVYHGDMGRTDDLYTHAWNMVKIDDKYYHCDITFELQCISSFEGRGESLTYPYIFGKNDEYMLQYSYSLQDESAPKASEGLSSEYISQIMESIQSR